MAKGRSEFVQPRRLTFPPKEVMSARVEIRGQAAELRRLDDGKIALRKRFGKQSHPRMAIVEMVFQRPITLAHMEMTYPAGSVHLTSTLGVRIEPARSIVTIQRSRDNGPPKVLARYYLGAEVPVVEMPSYLSRFKAIVAVDTNSQVVRGQMTHVTGFVRARPLGRYGEDVAFHTDYANAFTTTDPDDKPERRGWVAALQHIEQMENLTTQDPVLIVVDSDLGALESIARRQSPVWKDVRVLPNTMFMYATDSGGAEEYLPNSLIREADGVAARRLEELSTQNAE